MFDTHMHCEFSVDSKMTLQEAWTAAERLNMGIVITEHMDLDYPTNPESFVFDVREYFREFAPHRKDKLLLGIEIGMQPLLHEQNNAVLAQGAFDMVIGSIHVAGGVDVYSGDFYRGREKSHTYRLYFEDMLRCVDNFQNFDTLGHIDYISRYALYHDPELYLQEHREIWTEICKILIANGKALEINTRRTGSAQVRAALQPFYELYARTGGRYVTLGSDSHSSGEVGARIQDAFAWAESMNLQPVYFKNRQLCIDYR